MKNTKDLIAFVKAIEAIFPHDAPRDRFGRYVESRNTELLRQLAIKYKIENGGEDSMDQAGMVARNIIKAMKL